jgi:hypothetical protein
MNHSFSDEILVDGVRSGNQFMLAVVAGVVMAIGCAFIWMVAAFFAGPKLDYLAVGVGVLIGFSIRFSGKGTTPFYGFLAMVLTLLSSLLGNVLGVMISGTHDNLDIFTVAQMVKLPDLVMGILTQATVATYLLFATGVVLAFLISVKRQ